MIINTCVVFTSVKITLVLGMVAHCMRKQTFSAAAVPVLRVNCPILAPLLATTIRLFSPSCPHLQTSTTSNDFF